MFSRLREHFGTAGLIVAIVALIAALAGGAIAATGGSGGGKATASAKGKQGPRGKTGKTGPAGPAGATGPAGAAGPTGAQGAQGEQGEKGEKGAKGDKGLTGTTGTSVTVAGEATGSANCEGRGGASFEAEGSSTKQYACNGKEGPKGADGETGFTKTLPSGKTETGLWNFGAIPKGDSPADPAHDSIFEPISFPIPLAEPIGPDKVHFLTQEQTENKSEPKCPGTVENPQAAPGHLCVYTSRESHEVVIPAEEEQPERVIGAFIGLGPDNAEGAGGASTSGALLQFIIYTEGAFARGSWAVTAPLPAP